MFNFVRDRILDAALILLPRDMDSPEARVMLLAMGLQESRFLHRRQIRGPAHGFWQFESSGGVKGVLSHPATKEHARRVCGELQYIATQDIVYEALPDNDILAACFARLLLFTHPDPLPGPSEAGPGWAQYIACWRPGKPHPDTWLRFYRQACEAVYPTYSSGE